MSWPIELEQHIKSVVDANHSKMIRISSLRTLRHEKIVDCNISQATFDNKKMTFVEFTETGRLHSISLEQNLIE